MMTDLPEISVVVCAYTEARWEQLVAAVDSLQHQSAPVREIILVIDHNPALYERARTALLGVALVENREARGLSGARNSGIARAQAEVIAFMDEDALAEPDWIQQLQEGYRSPDVLGVGGAIQPLWANGRPAWFPEEFDWVVGCTYRGMPTEPAPVRNLIGCNMSFRREVFQVVGGFRTGMGRIGTLPVGCEETELCIRTHHRLPGTLLYVPAARVLHRVPPNRAGLGYFFSRCYSEGISKSQVAHWVGAGDGLATERAYTLHALPEGVWRGLRDAVAHRSPGGLGRAALIITGLGVTTIGYLAGRIMERFVKPAAQSADLPPILEPVRGAGPGDPERTSMGRMNSTQASPAGMGSGEKPDTRI